MAKRRTPAVKDSANSKDPIEDKPEEIKDTVDTPEPDEPEVTEPTEPEQTEETESTPPVPVPARKRGKLPAWLTRKRVITGAVVAVVIIGALLAIPPTRYALAGLVLKTDVQLEVQDTTTGKPVSNAQVVLDSTAATTNNEGKVQVRARPGKRPLRIQKKYYNDYAQTVTVAIGKMPAPVNSKMVATGRQVPLSVINRISGKPMENVLVKALDTEGKTDKDGKLTLVVPADKATIAATLSATGFNESKVTITVTEQTVKENDFPLTPTGKLYFLSKKSGKIDVVKTNLDGTERKTVLAGTGKEEDGDTVLLASRDWKYLALKSRREGDKAKLYLIDTAADKMTTMDEGDAQFTPVGWYNDRFVFQVLRNKPAWEPKRQALKSYDAKAGQIKILDETQAEGSSYDFVSEYFDSVYILENEIVYTKAWSFGYSYRVEGKSSTINSVRPEGSNKKVLHSVKLAANAYASINAKLYHPEELYYWVQQGEGKAFYEYEDGTFKEAKDVTAETFNKPYPTYLLSPSGKQTFWHEARDGKNTLFVGTASGEDEQELATLSEQTTYGWFTDDYLLVSQKGSELYIMSKQKGAVPVKVTDYHKPSQDFRGYGYGYGGL